MSTNIEKFKGDLDKLIFKGQLLFEAMQRDCNPEEYEKQLRKTMKEQYTTFIKKLPVFSADYQMWYSEALALIRQLLPDRMADFAKLYERPKTTRKEITHENYTIEDYLFGLIITFGAGMESAIPRFFQQLGILKSAKQRFESSLFDIKQVLQADLFDSELEAAKELNKKGFMRGAGAVAGVVLEKHLAQICANHNVNVTKKNPGINDYNQILKDNNIIDVKDWRFIQRLADLRNMCDHDKKVEPKKEDIDDLIQGTERVSKTLF